MSSWSPQVLLALGANSFQALGSSTLVRIGYMYMVSGIVLWKGSLIKNSAKTPTVKSFFQFEAKDPKTNKKKKLDSRRKKKQKNNDNILLS